MGLINRLLSCSRNLHRPKWLPSLGWAAENLHPPTYPNGEAWGHGPVTVTVDCVEAICDDCGAIIEVPYMGYRWGTVGTKLLATPAADHEGEAHDA